MKMSVASPERRSRYIFRQLSAPEMGRQDMKLSLVAILAVATLATNRTSLFPFLTSMTVVWYKW